MKKKYVLKNKKRFFTFIIVNLILLTTIITCLTVNAQEKISFHTIVVRQGDTLWEIAQKYSTNKDIRSYIYDIEKYNNLDSATIYVGQELLIPR